MKIKRITAALLAAAMLVGTAGCGKTENKDSSAAESSKAQSGEDNNDNNSESSDGVGLPAQAYLTNCDGSARVTVEGTKFMVGGRELWFNGANTPWDKWNDFGGSFNFEFWNDHLSKLHDAGVNAIRVWVICNGDVGMAISPDGSFDGATTAHWEDLDELFMLAEQYEIYIMATVQSFDNFKDTNNNYMAWRELIQSSEKTDQFVENYIIPFVQRYDSCDYLWSIDLCNEPDWIVENSECGKLDWLSLEQYYAKACAAIHANSDVLVTVGLGMIKYNSDNQVKNVISDSELRSLNIDPAKYDLDLAYVDFYSTHWYSWMLGNWGRIYDKSPEAFGLDGTKPAVIGEMPAVSPDDSGYEVVSAYKQAYENGWNGVFAWKTSGTDDGCGLWMDIKPAITAMMEICPEKIFPAKS